MERSGPDGPADWKRIKTILADALELPPDERAAFLDAACADELGLRSRVDRFLEDAPAGPEFLAGMDAERAAALIRDEDAEPVVPESVGPFRIVREIARGGMGAVYLAERVGQDFSQRVALKLVKRGMDSDAILAARFARERRILARLDHESIARLLDGGTAEDGRPFLVMEFVDGKPLTAHCDERRLPIDARLRLLLTVCRAVQHAHANLVVHRDLKPSNVLVTGDGRVKLLDFGIAGILESDREQDATTLTVHGLWPLTPEYAAPEQLSGEPTTVATDVWGLGVLLYHLLTGDLPHGSGERSSDAVARAVLSTDPVRPSAAIGSAATPRLGGGRTNGESAEYVASARSSRPQSLARRLAGDLDAIVLKALRKEPGHRYASVEALADDLERHLSGAPVAARKGTFRYRGGKFVRRHAFGLGVTAAGTAAAAAFLAFHLHAVARERDAASLQAARAEQVSQFVIDLFDRSDPLMQAEGDSLTVEQLVDAGAARIQSDLAGQPELQAEVQIVLGRLLNRLGRFHEARTLFESALATRSELFGEESAEAAQAMLYVAEAVQILGEYQEAEQLQRRVLEIRNRIGASGQERATVLAELGSTLISLGDLAGADTLIAEALRIRQALPDGGPFDLGHTLEYMARVRREQGNLAEAADLSWQAIAVVADHYGEEHRLTNGMRRQLALVLTSDSRYEEAEAVYRRVLAADVARLGEDHPTTAMTLHDLGSLLLEMRRLDEAETLLRQALQVRETSLGPSSARVGMTLSKLATLLTFQDRNEEALALHRRALEIRRAVYGPRSSSVGTGLNQLGVTLSNMGREEEAIEVLREAADIYREQRGEGHWWVAVAVNNEGHAWYRLGNMAMADSLFRERLAINREALGPEHYSTGNAVAYLGRVAAKQGRWVDASTFLAEALPIYEARLAADDVRVDVLRSELGEALSVLGRVEEAERLLEAAAGETDAPAVKRRLEEHRRRVAPAGPGSSGH